VAGGHSVFTVQPGTTTSTPIDPNEISRPFQGWPHHSQLQGELNASSR
jgi:hypothetical protein